MELVTWAPHDRTKFRYQLNKLLYTVLSPSLYWWPELRVVGLWGERMVSPQAI